MDHIELFETSDPWQPDFILTLPDGPNEEITREEVIAFFLNFPHVSPDAIHIQ